MNSVGSTGIHCRLKKALSGFSLEVDVCVPGRGVTAIFGPSGSGKTTLLRCIAGLELARSTYLCVNGQVWQDDSQGVFLPVHRRPLGYVFQEASLFKHLTVQDNLDYGLKRVPASERRVSLAQTIALLGIETLLQRRPATLSGGERQRVAIARALATSPRLLLMDEPLASLDAARKADILPYLERLHGELDIPVLYVSHAPDEVARLADHLVLIEAGRVTAAGPARELMTRLDLPMAHGDSAAAIIDATITGIEAAYHLSHAEFAGGRISLLNPGLTLGERVRVRVQARDVSIALERPTGSSVQNIFPVTVRSLSPDAPGQVMLALDAGGIALLARITHKSVETLGLEPGSKVFAQVKGVAIMG